MNACIDPKREKNIKIKPKVGIIKGPRYSWCQKAY